MRYDVSGTVGSAQDLTLTLFGDYFIDRPDPVWVGHIIELLETLEVSPGATRTALSRMSARGWLESTRRGRLGFYGLSDRGRQLLEEGRDRIHGSARSDTWDGRWSIVTYSVPEEEREIRDRLRTRLTWIGCGSLGNGTWISPHDVSAPVQDMARELGVREGLHLFRGGFGGPGSPRELVARCWDLTEANRAYRAFIQRFTPVLERCGRDRERFGRLCPAESFFLRFHLTHEFRGFPHLDPDLPPRFLPPDWAGLRAGDLFRRLHDLLEAPAEAHVRWVLDDQGSRRIA